MKKIFASVLIVIGTFSMSCSQTPSNTAKGESVFGPAIEFKELVHDYGTIEQSGDGAYVFKFANTGTEPLILSNVRSSCGCTIPEWPREPINAGASGSILVKYNTARIGSFSKSISVYSNASEAAIVLRIKGNVVAKAEAAASAAPE